MAHHPDPNTVTAFRLLGYGNGRADLLVVVPELNMVKQVGAAWAYAVRYTAKGIDLPDHDAAIRMMKERHPSWLFIESDVLDIHVNLKLADEDVPEGV